MLIPLYRIMIGLHMVDTYRRHDADLCFGLSAADALADAQRLRIAADRRLRKPPSSTAPAGSTSSFGSCCRLVGPGLTAAAILTFLGAWGQYLVPLIFSPTATKPLTVLVPEFATKNFIDYGLITPSGSIAIVIPALVVIFLNRYLVSGLLAGSVR